MGLIKLASVDISKQRLNNNSVIAPSLLVSPGLDRCYQLCVAASRGRPISRWACLHLISPSHFTERKFLEGWARQIATDLSLPSRAVSFLSSGWLDYPPGCGRTHPSPPEERVYSSPSAAHLSLLNEAGRLPVDSGGSSLKLPPCWEFELEEGGPLWTCQRQRADRS